MTRNQDITMVCDLNVDLVQSRSIQKYIFKGKNDKVETEDLNVKIYFDDVNLIDDYKKIIDGKNECGNIQIFDDSISYHCFYDLVNEHQYYFNIEENDGTLFFKKLKAELEKDNYICFYK